MPLLVTSAFGANGNGHGALLAFDRDGRPLGVFSKDSRIVDPRGTPAGWRSKRKNACCSSTARIGCWRSIPPVRSCAITA